MNKITKLFTLSVVLLSTTSCITDSYYGDGGESSVYRSQSNSKYKKAMKSIEQQNLKMASLEELSIQNGDRIAYLEQQLSTLISSMGESSSGYTRLKQQLAAERTERERMTKAMQKQFSKELAKTETTLRKNQNKVIKAISNSTRHSSNYGTYTVKSGDSLSIISKAAGVSVATLKKINRLNSDMIRIGQKLKIPAN